MEVSAHKIELKLMSGKNLDNNVNIANVSYQWIKGTKQALGEFKSPDMHSEKINVCRMIVDPVEE